MSDPHRPILLVEDNPMDVELALRAFKPRRLDRSIQVARDGQEAMDWVARWERGEPWPVMVLLDLKLPRVDGIEVLRRIKQHPLLRVIPVVMLTTSGVAEDLAAAYQAGANAYIVKPLDFDEFAAAAAALDHYWSQVNRLPY